MTDQLNINTDTNTNLSTDDKDNTITNPVLKRSYTLSSIEFYKFQLNQIINSKVNQLNDTDLTILAYIHIFGKNSTEVILRDRILTNLNSVRNYISRLTKRGYLHKVYEDDPSKKHSYTDIILNPKIKLLSQNYVQVSVVQLDPESDEVYHVNYRK